MRKPIGTREKISYILGALIVVCTFSLLVLLVIRTIPDTNKDMFNLVLGAILGSFTGVVNYFFGSSLGSREKNELLKDKMSENSDNNDLKAMG